MKTNLIIKRKNGTIKKIDLSPLTEFFKSAGLEMDETIESVTLENNDKNIYYSIAAKQCDCYKERYACNEKFLMENIKRLYDSYPGSELIITKL